MERTSERSLFDALNAELGAVLTARKAALEFERQLASLDQKDRLGRELFELRSAEAMLAGAQGPEGEALLGPLAQTAADDLEQVSAGLYKVLADHAQSSRDAHILAVSALIRFARLSEARTRAFMTAARQGRRLDGFDEALALAPETEQLLLALRRFQALLERGGAWDPRDAEQLYLRALSAPGRLRLQAASLRSSAVALGGLPLPGPLQEAMQPFQSLGLSAPLSLAWALAGFSAEQCVDWREAGLRRPEQAYAWHCHGFDPVEAAAWAKADMLPDEAGAFVFCGVGGLEEALALRKALADVEHLLTWKRAGFDGRRVLELLTHGIRTPDQALAQGHQPGGLHAGPARVMPGDEVPGVGTALPPLEAPVLAAPEPEAPAAAAVESFPPAEGGAWLAWGAAHAEGKGQGAALRTRELGGAAFDVIAGSELIVPLGSAQAPSSLQAEADWEAQLGRAGAWHLHAFAPAQALLTWGLVLPAGADPWAEAVDRIEGETWSKRWARKTEDWGEPGVKAPCQMGRTADGGWWIGFKLAIYSAEPGAAPLSFDPAWPTAAWRESFEDFCLKMEIPRQAPHWVLLSTKAVAK